MNRSVKILIGICYAALLSSSFAGPDYYDKMREGIKSFAENQLDEAERLFTESVQVATNDASATALANYNLGNVKVRQGYLDAASQQFASALAHEDETVRTDAYYNRGVTLYQQAKALEEEQDLDNAIMNATGALEMFENALEIDASGNDLKANLELAYDYREILLEKKQQQEQEQEQQQDQENNEDGDEQEEQQNEDGENQEEQDQSQENQDDQNQEQQDQSGDQQNQDQSQENDDQQSEQQNQPENGEEDEGQEENQQQPSEGDESQDGEQGKEQPQGAGEQAHAMSREEAMMLLDGLREQEENERSKFRIQYGSPNRNPIAKPY